MHQKYPNSLLPIHCFPSLCLSRKMIDTIHLWWLQVLYLRSIWLSAFKDDIKQHVRDTSIRLSLLPFYRSGFSFPQTEDSQHKGIQDSLHSNSVLCQRAQGLRELSNQGWKDSNICLLVTFFFFHLINIQNHIFSVISTLNRILSLLHSFGLFEKTLENEYRSPGFISFLFQGISFIRILYRAPRTLFEETI